MTTPARGEVFPAKKAAEVAAIKIKALIVIFILFLLFKIEPINITYFEKMSRKNLFFYLGQ